MHTVKKAITEISGLTMGDIYKCHPAGESLVEFIVEDAEFNDTYRFKLQKTNKGLGCMASLNGQAAYNADMLACGQKGCEEMVNLAAGGVVISDGKLVA